MVCVPWHSGSPSTVLPGILFSSPVKSHYTLTVLSTTDPSISRIHGGVSTRWADRKAWPPCCKHSVAARVARVQPPSTFVMPLHPSAVSLPSPPGSVAHGIVCEASGSLKIGRIRLPKDSDGNVPSSVVASRQNWASPSAHQQEDEHGDVAQADRELARAVMRS